MDGRTMTRSTARHPSAVQTDKSSPPISEVSSDDPSSPQSASGVPWYWRLVMFMWIVSFVSLLIYEWLGGAIKSLTSKS
jgi:hypothetical protein